MPKRPVQIANGAVERDLVRLTHERVSHAILSVYQIAEGDGQVMCVAMAAITAALGSAVGAFRALDQIDRNLDDIAASRVILDMLEASRREAAAHG